MQAAGNDALVAKGVEPIVVDYTSPTSLQSALRGIDVVISTLGGAALPLQPAVGDAAKAVGVKLFVPSEFGGNTLGATEGFFALKNAQREYLESIGLPWAVFFNGPWSDWICRSLFGLEVKSGKVEVGGTGDELCSFISRRDIARYLVHVLLNVPEAKLHNGVFKVEGERTSLNRVLEAYQARTGKKVEITRVSLEESKVNAAKGDWKGILQVIQAEHGVPGPEEEMNVDWPEFDPQTAIDALLGSNLY